MSLSVARLRLSIVDIVDILDVPSARTVAGLFVKVLSPQLQTNAFSRRKADKPISANWVENHPVEINRGSPVRVGDM